MNRGPGRMDGTGPGLRQPPSSSFAQPRQSVIWGFTLAPRMYLCPPHSPCWCCGSRAHALPRALLLESGGLGSSPRDGVSTVALDVYMAPDPVSPVIQRVPPTPHLIARSRVRGRHPSADKSPGSTTVAQTHQVFSFFLSVWMMVLIWFSSHTLEARSTSPVPRTAAQDTHRYTTYLPTLPRMCRALCPHAERQNRGAGC